MIEAIIEMQRAYYEETGRRLTMLACGPRLYSVLRAEASKRCDMECGPNYGHTLHIGSLTVIESLGEGMVWA